MIALSLNHQTVQALKGVNKFFWFLIMLLNIKLTLVITVDAILPQCPAGSLSMDIQQRNTSQ